MSVALPAMFRDQVNTSMARGAQDNLSGMLSHLQSAPQKLRSESPIAQSSPDARPPVLTLKRTYSAHDLIDSSVVNTNIHKRPCLLLPPSSAIHSLFLDPLGSQQGSLADAAVVVPQQKEHEEPKITLPSLNDALAHIEQKRHSAPTVSQDYPDTCQPHDEQWRYGLLDTIRKTKPTEIATAPVTKPKLPSIQELNSREKPLFDSRVAHKGLPAFPVRKVNFPYESNYTYLNQTYMKDVEQYPEYLELAQSLVLLSRPQPQTNPLVYAYNAGSRNPGLRIQTHHYQQHQQLHAQHFPYAQEAHLNKTMMQHGLPTPQLATFSAPMAYAQGYIPAPKSAPLPSISQIAYGTPDSSFETKPSSPSGLRKEKSFSGHPVSVNMNNMQSNGRTRFIPITPPSVKNKTRSELMKSPSRVPPALPRMCISCGSDLSPCWRPSWSPKEGQLCNSCGLRYKKTAARCLNDQCRRIPAKGEWNSMVSKGMALYDGVEAYSCLGCGYKVETK